MDILVKGEKRFNIKELYDEKPYTESKVTFFDDVMEGTSDALHELRMKAVAILKKMGTPGEAGEALGVIKDLDTRYISFLLAFDPDLSPEEKQAFLQMTSTEERLRKGIAALGKIHERRRLAQEIRNIVGGNGGVPKSLRSQALESAPRTEV
jgi:ATP-dependent Lon protease